MAVEDRRVNMSQLFLLAARDGDLWTMGITLLLGADINAQTYPEQESALILAVNREDVEAVRCLLSWGADVNLADREGMSPLHHAAKRSSLIWSLLVDHGASDDLKNNQGLSAAQLRAGMTARQNRRMSHGL